MSAEDWLPDYDPDEEDFPSECNRCGAYPLYWTNTANGYRLFTETGEPHVCDTSAKRREFKDLDREA